MPDIQVQPWDDSGQPSPAHGGRGGADLITTGGRAGPADAMSTGRARRLVDRLAGLPAVRRWVGRPVPASLVAAAAAVVGGAAVASYMDRPVETVLPGPMPVRLILEPETWLDARVEPVHDPVASSQLPAEQWQRALDLHAPESVVVLPLSTEPQLFGLPPGQFQAHASCHATDMWPGGEVSQVTIWITPIGRQRHDGVPVTCDGHIAAVAQIANSPDYRPLEAIYFPHPPPGTDGHGETPETPALVVVVSLIAVG